MEGKSEGVFVCFDGWIVAREHCCDCGCNLCRVGEENGGLTPANINHNINTILMFHETEFRMTCRDRNKPYIFLGHFYGKHRFLEIRLSYFH